MDEVINICECDPLKCGIRLVLTEYLRNKFRDKWKGNDVLDLSEIHLFYKSLGWGGVREGGGGGCLSGGDKDKDSENDKPLVEKGEKLVWKISCEDTLKFLVQWAEGKVEKGGLILEKVDGGDDWRELGYLWDSSMDLIGNLGLSVGLDGGGLTREVIRWLVFGDEGEWRKCLNHSKYYKVEIALMAHHHNCQGFTLEEKSSEAFLKYRKLLVAQATTRLLQLIGHSIDTTQYTQVSPQGLGDEGGVRTILIAAFPQKTLEDPYAPQIVLRSEIGEVDTTAGGLQDLFKSRLTDIKKISESRRLNEEESADWVNSLDNMARATVHWDLLSKPVDKQLRLSVDLQEMQMNHDALFIMYNYSRVCGILRKFGEATKSKIYPEPMTFNEIDFRLIWEDEEIKLVQLLIEAPRILEGGILNFGRMEGPNFQMLTRFLLALAKGFNQFYFQICVLTPPNAPHNFPWMNARIWLLKAVLRVFQICLDILEINYHDKLKYED